jgi:hypothetical protein
MPLAILYPPQLLYIWYGMELGEFNLPLLKQQIKYIIGLSDIKAKFFWLLFAKGAGHYLLAYDPLCEPYHIVFII